ncbi:MAG: hypothetical protein JOZ46_06090 [Candidatus Dormibacteraeota bacterium]|nr:hypothetical protein [Candidatus Dormibacteraeota bacterium]MBV9525368.1 hypothetical protein [Candidatus Dormibacteraeota bacterium]
MTAAPQPAEETYLARACRLVAEHAELFRAPAPRIVRLLPPLPPAPPRRPRRPPARQLRLPIAPTMRR